MYLRRPIPRAASGRCSPATPPPPGYRTTCRPTGYGTSCSPGSRPKASTMPSSSPTAATPAANHWRSKADPPSPTPKQATTRRSADSRSEDHPSLELATRSGVPGRLEEPPGPPQQPDPRNRQASPEDDPVRAVDRLPDGLRRPVARPPRSYRGNQPVSIQAWLGIGGIQGVPVIGSRSAVRMSVPCLAERPGTPGRSRT
jgi:hypothetical protein